ncbi:MAG: metal ABC transporter solute-binding protein, Zn/Mn family, partial [Patescibacteria group bacterium]
NIYDAARRYNVKVIFSEPQFSNETLKPFLSDLNLKMFVLDPESGLNGQLGYVDLLRYNIDTIYQALLND